MNKKLFIAFALAFVLMLLPSVFAAVHGINGYVADADDGTKADGAVAIFYIETRPTEILTDVVGPLGNSKEHNFYSIDVENFLTPWHDGDKLIIMIMKDEYHGAITQVILHGEGNQQALNTKLGQCEGSRCSFCGDAYCDELCNETLETCPIDCGGAYCGDGTCSATEDCLLCPIDCPASECGDSICDCPETIESCPLDCAPHECDNDGICEYGETAANCPDCLISSCGNGKCETSLGETDDSCPIDCPPVVCGDGLCEIKNGENAKNCPADCQRLSLKCGNKKCEPGESSENCCFDCGCPKGEQCIKNNCVSCCFIGICFGIVGICWYWILTILITIAIVVTIIVIEKKKKKQAVKVGKAVSHMVFRKR